MFSNLKQVEGKLRQLPGKLLTPTCSSNCNLSVSPCNCKNIDLICQVPMAASERQSSDPH